MQALFPNLLCPSGPYYANLTGRTAVITGGATGIGFEIARYFCLMGSRVIMINRKKEQGDEAIAKIKKDYLEKKGEDGAKIEWVGCDLGRLRDVREVFGDLEKKLDKLNFVVCSSSINSNQFGLDDDGIDRHFGVNALGHYYALNLLYPLLRRTSKLPDTPKGSVRIIFESSEMHRMAPGSEDSKSRKRGCHFGSEEEITEYGKELGPMELYGRTKLAMILYAKMLRDKVIKKNGDDIRTIAVHPGTVDTDMQDQWNEAYPGILGEALKKFAIATSRSPEQGSYSGLYAACSDDVVKNDWNGVYLSDPGTLGKESAQGEDLNLGAALWELSERMVTRIVGKDALVPWDKA